VIDPLLSLTHSAGASQTDWRLEVVGMSRKDYVQFAKVLGGLALRKSDPRSWEVVVDRLIEVLQKDNPRFSSERFWDYIER
jgi:hypothetical protein